MIVLTLLLSRHMSLTGIQRQISYKVTWRHSWYYEWEHHCNEWNRNGLQMAEWF